MNRKTQPQITAAQAADRFWKLDGMPQQHGLRVNGGDGSPYASVYAYEPQEIIHGRAREIRAVTRRTGPAITARRTVRKARRTMRTLKQRARWGIPAGILTATALLWLGLPTVAAAGIGLALAVFITVPTR